MPLVLLLLLLAAECRSRLVNVTIDDQHGDAVTGVKPVYSPGRNWHAVSESSAGLLDMAQVHDRTLQSLQRNGSIALAFEGVVIYVFFVLPEPVPALNVTSFLDSDTSKPVGQYTPSPGVGAMGGGPNRFAYNQLVFSSGPLAQREHNLTIEVQSYLTYFDYAIYTVDDGAPDSSPTGSSPTTKATAEDAPRKGGAPDRGALIGGVVAAAAMCIVLLCIWRCITTRRNQPATLGLAENAMGREEPREYSVSTLVIGDTVSPFFARAESTRGRADFKQDAWRSASEKATTTEGTVTREPGPGDSMSSLGFRSSEAAALLNPSPTSGGHWTRSTINSHSGASVDVREELERIRTEIDMLRRVARAVGPPPYSDGGWSERSAPTSF